MYPSFSAITILGNFKNLFSKLEICILHSEKTMLTKE